MKAIGNCAVKSEAWSRDKFGCLPALIKEEQKELEDCVALGR